MGIFVLDQPGLVINDLEVLKNVLVKDFQYFPNRTISVSEDVDPMYARVIFTLKRKEFPLVEKCADDLDNFLENAIAQGKFLI